MIYPKKDYQFIEFVKSPIQTKKYRAILQNKKTGRLVKIDFGGVKKDGTPYTQYKDTTGLGLYSDYDHLDKKRRARYRKRHKVNSIKPFSANYFSWFFLW
jgi:hypothetical protein